MYISRKTSYIVGVIFSLFLGIGIGIEVFRRPTATLAVPGYAVDEGIRVVPSKLRLSATGDVYLVTQGEDSNLEFHSNVPIQYKKSSGKLGGTRPVQLRVGSVHQSAHSLRELALGDTLELEGSNNGRYQFQVVGRVTTTSEHLSELEVRPESLQIVIADALWNTKMTVILAQELSR